MKKIFAFALCMGAMMVANAQVVISPTGMMDEIGMQAEGMSPDASSYVAGSNQLNSQAAIWNVATDEVWEFGGADTVYQPIYAVLDSVWEYQWGWSEETQQLVLEDSIKVAEYDYDNIIGYDSTLWDLNTYGGSFHAVNNSGLAVGTYGGSYGGRYPAKANYGDAEITYLYAGEGEDGGDAYAVNADGSLIVGFYTMGMNAQACLWKNGGLNAEDRIELPAPTEEDFGGPIDYVSARWMSEDGSVILGYAQDFDNGRWVMIHWTLENDGTYAVHSDYAKQYFTSSGMDEEWNSVWTHPERPYNEFEPQALSANGEWATLTVKPLFDLNDWEAIDYTQAARINLKTGVLDTLAVVADEANAPIFYGIANNGTAVGATAVMQFGPWAPERAKMAAMGEEDARNGFVWYAGETVSHTLQEVFDEEEYFLTELAEYEICGINADGSKIVGFKQETDGMDTWVVTSFVAELPVTAVEHVADGIKGVKMIENGQVVIIREGVKYNMMGQRF